VSSTRTRRAPLAGCAFAALLSAGCTFHTTVWNPQNRDLDLSWIEVGKTSWMDVLHRFGPPMSATNTQELFRPEINQNSLRYSVWVDKNAELSLRYFVGLPFEWGDARSVQDILIEFDDAGLVKEVWSGTAETSWRPLFADPTELHVERLLPPSTP
jgi:hypothetical protein